MLYCICYIYGNCVAVKYNIFTKTNERALTTSYAHFIFAHTRRTYTRDRHSRTHETHSRTFAHRVSRAALMLITICISRVLVGAYGTYMYVYVYYYVYFTMSCMVPLCINGALMISRYLSKCLRVRCRLCAVAGRVFCVIWFSGFSGGCLVS